MFSSQYFQIDPKTNISQAQLLAAWLGGSMVQTVLDNPVTSYRQLVQQYAKNVNGKTVHPDIAKMEAKQVFMNAPVSASMSGVTPRLFGVFVKRIPKFGILHTISLVVGENENTSFSTAFAASILSAPFINPTRMIEKQQRAYFRETGKEKPLLEIFKESKQKHFKPLFRGTTPLMLHSCASATLGLVAQRRVQAYIKRETQKYGVGDSLSNLIASAAVTPMYVAVTNPISRLEVIMQTNSIKGESITLRQACKELVNDSKQFGLQGMFRGQGIGIVKGIISLTLFHEGRMFFTKQFKQHNTKEKW